MKIIAAALAVTTVLGSPALAQMRSRDSPSSLYLFGEYEYYTDSSKFRGGGGGLGWNFNHYLGVQGGAQFLASSESVAGLPSTVTSGAVDLDTTVLYAEAKLSWPLTERFFVYASGGGAYADGSAGIKLLTVPSSTISVSRSASGYRWGWERNIGLPSIGGCGPAGIKKM